MYVTYGINVFGIDPSLDRYEIANQAIEKTTQVFRDMGLKLTLRDIGITDKTYFEEMAVKAARGCEGSFVELTKDDGTVKKVAVLEIADDCGLVVRDSFGNVETLHAGEVHIGAKGLQG